jgi:hypothetical protein
MDDKKSLVKTPIFICKNCHYTTVKHNEYTRHLMTAKHIRMTEKVAEISKNISCIYCDYTTCKLTDYKKHLLTAKHIRMTSLEKISEKNSEIFKCDCGKIYKYRQGLFRHKNICHFAPPHLAELKALQNLQNITMETTKLPGSNADLIMEIIKENKEFKTLLIEQCKQSDQQQQRLMDLQKENNTLINKMVEITQNQLTIPTTINNNNNTINNNQKFNLNFFLNETCKDAMNIQEFIENIKVTFDDLLTIGDSGFVNGLSDILLKQLKDLDVTKRPIHCTDSKRETIYLKENDSWNKDDKENNKLKDVIEKVEKKNVISLHQWCSENPDSKVNNTPNNLLRDKIFLQTLQGDDKTRDKIIKNISKEVTVDKE